MKVSGSNQLVKIALVNFDKSMLRFNAIDSSFVFNSGSRIMFKVVALRLLIFLGSMVGLLLIVAINKM